MQFQKKMIYLYSFDTLNWLINLLLLVLAFVTSFYIFKAYFMIFEGEERTSIILTSNHDKNLEIFINILRFKKE